MSALERRAEDRDWIGIAAILACAAAVSLPLLARGISCGHDFDFHLLSWMETLRAWNQGVWYPHWAASPNYGAGEPRFVFYPPASWLLGALLGSVAGWTLAPVLFVLLALVASGLSLHALARKWMDRDAARLAACLYVVNPYFLFNTYERAAYGELLAAVWPPLVVLFALRARPSITGLSLAIAGVWLTNAPTAVMTTYLLAFVATIAAFTYKHWAPLLRAAAGGVLGLALAGFYLIPAAVERRWVEIDRAISEGMRAEDSFLFERTGHAFHDQVLRSASWIAVAMLAASLLAALFAWRTKQERAGRAERRTLLLALTILPAAVALLLLPLSEPAWRYVPELKFLQFPWRWLLILSAALAMLTGLASEKLPRARVPAQRAVLIGAVLLVLAGGAAALFYQPCDAEDAVSAQVTTFQSHMGVEGTDEYTPLAADNSQVEQHLPPARLLASPDEEEAESEEPNPVWTKSVDELPAQIETGRWHTERKELTVEAAQPGFLVLRLMDYPAWRVALNGREIAARPKREDGLMALPLPAGRSRIEIRYRATPDIMWGRALSLAALAVVLLLAVIERRKARPAQV